MRVLFSNILVLSLCGVCAGEEAAKSAAPDHPFKVPPRAEELLESYCYDCHDSDLSKGDIRFDNLGELPQGKRLDLLNNALEQVFSGEMPPKKGDQPTTEERDELAEWMWADLKSFNASRLEDKLRYYKYANYINHDKLFGGEIKAAPYTPSRRWRINELIYHERINDVFELEGRERQASFQGVVKPFNLPKESGVQYYDTEVVEGGQFLTLMANAKWVVDKQLRKALEESGQFKHPADYQSVLDGTADGKERGKILQRYPDERWNLKKTAEPFKQVIIAESVPSDDVLKNAITHQFRVVMQRDPNPEETEEYLAFMRETIKVSDKVSALKKMMVSVLMEPEFLYRNEFGGGEPDEHGRLKLTPREASYAIAYALTDKIPDQVLVEAAASGRLETKEDYEREVRRILADDSIDKPRILRFFQDYFGYLKIYDVFKDEERFVGAYNPHRVISTSYIYRIPGKISKEADLLVEWVLEKDQDVLKTLLTTDKYFVHHTGDNEEMRKKTEDAQKFYSNLRKIYVATRNADKKDYVKIVTELGLGDGYVSPAKGDKKAGFNRKFGIDMMMAEIFFGKDGSRGKTRTGSMFLCSGKP